MIARLPLAALGLVLVATLPLAAKEKAKAPQSAEAVACEGVFGPTSTEALVKQTFGAENVVTGTVPGPEGEDMLATTVFPDDPARTMEFGWFDEENLTHLSYVQLSPAQIAPGGARVGMTVAEVEKLNGKPFKVGGFWWDYGGYALIESGKLANGEDDTGCYLSIRFAPRDDIPQSIDVGPVSGEVQVSSTDPLLARIDTRVQSITLGYAWPDDLPQPEY